MLVFFAKIKVGCVFAFALGNWLLQSRIQQRTAHLHKSEFKQKVVVACMPCETCGFAKIFWGPSPLLVSATAVAAAKGFAIAGVFTNNVAATKR